METSKQQHRPSHAGVYRSCITVLVGQVLLLLHLLQHESIDTPGLGRYSIKFSSFLGGVVLASVGFGVFVVARWRHLPAFFSSLSTRWKRALGLMAALLVVGAFLLGGAFFFSSLISLFFPAPLFIGSLAVIYAGGVGLVFSSIPRHRATMLGQRVFLLALGTVLGLALGEGGLRGIAHFTPYRTLPANRTWEFKPAPEIMPGITGVSTYTTNEGGIRGDPYEPEGRYNVLTLGGSTTECAYLDDTEAWPSLVQEQLNRRAHRLPIWVGNVGRSGHRLVEHIYVLRYLVPQFNVDAVIVMVGINDFTPVWGDPHYPENVGDPKNISQLLYRSFYTRPLVDAAIPRPFPENLAIWNLVERGFWKLYRSVDNVQLNDLRIEDLAGLNYDKRRALYRSAPFQVGEVPGLPAALDLYEENLLTLIGTARAQDLLLILTTQPVIWKDHLSPEAEQLLWFGMTPPPEHSRYTPAALARAMDQFNERLLAVCRTTDTECIDLADAINGDERYFYDDVHFNELGAQTVAKLLVEYLARSGF